MATADITCTSSTYKPTLWDNVESAARSAASAAKNAAVKAKDGICTGYLWAGRKVEWLAHKVLPETAAKVVASVVWGLPYTVAALVAPKFVSDVTTGLSVGIWQKWPRKFDEYTTEDHRKHIFTGLRNAYIIRTGIDVVKLASSGNWWLLLPIIQNLFLTLQTNSVCRQNTPPEETPQADEPPKKQLTEQVEQKQLTQEQVTQQPTQDLATKK